MQDSGQTRKIVSRTVAIAFFMMACIGAVAAALEIYSFFEDRRPTAAPSPMISATVPAASSASPSPPQEPGAAPIPINEASATRHPLANFTGLSEGEDNAGRSWYENNSYNMKIYDLVNGWIWPLKNSESFDVAFTVEVMPVTDVAQTGYIAVVGWNKVTIITNEETVTRGDYHSFIVKANGKCGFLKYNQSLTREAAAANCPTLAQDEWTKLQIEVQRSAAQANEVCMRAFINDQHITTECFDDYEGGLIGLGVRNDSEPGSGAHTQVRFRDLTIWKIGPS